MRIPKRYGESREDTCPFCGTRAISKNKQGLNVCVSHKNEVMPDIKCVCGSYLDLKIGKFGPYFNCMNCGNMNLKKGLEMKETQKLYKTQSPKKQEKVPVNKKEEKDDFIIDTGKYDNFDYGIQ